MSILRAMNEITKLGLCFWPLYNDAMLIIVKFTLTQTFRNTTTLLNYRLFKYIVYIYIYYIKRTNKSVKRNYILLTGPVKYYKFVQQLWSNNLLKNSLGVQRTIFICWSNKWTEPCRISYIKIQSCVVRVTSNMRYSLNWNSQKAPLYTLI